MRKGTGNADIALVECINPKRNKWIVRWELTPTDDGLVSYMEEEFLYKPPLYEIRALVMGWYNEQTATEILTGFSWKGLSVWLSVENQFNYKATYDLAVQKNGSHSPVIFKFGSDQEPVYYTFSDVEELTDFYTSMLGFINDRLAEGWRIKDEIDWTEYGF